MGFYRNRKQISSIKIRQPWSKKKMNHTSYSMQNVLNEPINPILCKRILQEIKSPLLQQSFALTNDQSFTNLYINAPKRPNIPVTSQSGYQTRRPAIKNKYDNYGNGNSFYLPQNDNRPYLDNNNFLQTLTNRHEADHMGSNFKENNQIRCSRAEIQSIVSPLDPNITLKQHDYVTPDNGMWGNICGKLFNSDSQKQHQLQYRGTQAKYHRKRIFDQNKSKKLFDIQKKRNSQNHPESVLLLHEQKSHISVANTLSQKTSLKTVKQVTEQLRMNKHPQIAQFIQITTSIMDELKIAQKQRKSLLQNVEMVFQLSQTQSGRFQAIFQQTENINNFYNRMNISSVSDMLRKISREKLIRNNNNDLKEFNKQRNRAAESIQKMLLSFSSIQKLLEQFLHDKQAIHKLTTVHSILGQKFTNARTKNLNQQLINLYKDVRLFQYQELVLQLEYIWENLLHKVLSEVQFVNGFVRSKGICHPNEPVLQNDPFQADLSNMGFVKN